MSSFSATPGPCLPDQEQKTLGSLYFIACQKLGPLGHKGPIGPKSDISDRAESEACQELIGLPEKGILRK